VVSTRWELLDKKQKRTLIVDVPSSGSRSDFHSTILSSKQSPSQTYSWPLTQGVSAEVSIAGGNPQPEYFDSLRQYLALSERLVKSVFQEGDKLEYVDAYTGEVRYGTIERMYGSNAIIYTITKEEAGPNPRKFTPQHDPVEAARKEATLKGVRISYAD
jgi:hypothetical protein